MWPKHILHRAHPVAYAQSPPHGCCDHRSAYSQDTHLLPRFRQLLPSCLVSILPKDSIKTITLSISKVLAATLSKNKKKKNIQMPGAARAGIGQIGRAHV